MSPRSARMATCTGIVSFLAACVLVVRPFGDFPLNDDWAYAASVETFLQTGTLRLSDWVPASSVFHLGWGALWASLFGANHVVLRFSVLFWLAVAGTLLAATARRLGAPESASALAGFCLVANPLCLVFGLSYHTDVTFLALGIAALYCFIRSEQTDRNSWHSNGWLWAASLLVASSILTRQIGLGFAVGICATLAWGGERLAGRQQRQRWLAAVLPPLIASLGYWWWFRSTHSEHWASQAYLLEDARQYLSRPELWLPESLRRAVGAAAYAGLFALPMIVSAPAPRGKRAIAIAALAALAWLALGSLPYFANAIGALGIGTVTLHGTAAKTSGFFGLPFFPTFLTAVAWISLWWALGRARYRPACEPKRKLVVAYGLIWLGVFLLSMPKSTFFDRYLLVVLPAALVWAACFIPLQRPRLAAGAVTILALISLIGTADYFAWNAAKWRLGLRALQSGVAPADVAAGVDWDAHWTYAPNMATLKTQKALREIGRWDWQAMNSRRSLISFSSHTPPWVNIVDEESYWTPLSPRKRATLYRLERPSSRLTRRRTRQ